MPNLYGDILSDVAAQITGSVGLAGSANIGDHGAMFEAIHGSAPRRAGQNLANPSGLTLAAVQMLVYIDQPEIAEKIHNAWMYTLEQGIHTYDIYKEGSSKKKVGTREFAEAVIKNLGKKPETLPAVTYAQGYRAPKFKLTETSAERVLQGVDIYLYHRGKLEDFLAKISHINVGHLRLKMISNRGARVWPNGQPETFCIEQWRCRFTIPQDRTCTQREAIQVMETFDRMNLDVIKAEFLYSFDKKPGYSSADE
jgi:isocitrate dehydrogenase